MIYKNNVIHRGHRYFRKNLIEKLIRKDPKMKGVHLNLNHSNNI